MLGVPFVARCTIEQGFCAMKTILTSGPPDSPVFKVHHALDTDYLISRLKSQRCRSKASTAISRPHSWLTIFVLRLLVNVFNNPCFQYLDLIHRPVLRPRLHKPHSLHDPQSTLDSSKDCMFPIQPRRRCKRDKKLASIRIRTTICHTQNASPSVFQRWVYFVLELLPIDGAAASASSRWIASLEHEIGDDAMENNIVVVTSLS